MEGELEKLKLNVWLEAFVLISRVQYVKCTRKT